VVTPKLVAEIELLLRQLSASAASLSLENMRQVIQSPATKLFVARDHGVCRARIGRSEFGE
jgi:hypothetical protein